MPEGAGPAAPTARQWLRAGIVVPLVLLLLAGGIRMWRVSSPHRTYGDETFYAVDAWAYLGGMLPLPGHVVPPAPTINAETSWAHPPLGKWLIAAGEGATQNSPLGRRMPSVLFGTAGVLVVYLLALELWGSTWWAALAGLLLALDGLHIVQSRIAMLDIFLSTFVSAGVLFVVRDRNRMRDRAPSNRWERWFGTRDRFWAGMMFGAAVAVKWVGAWALLLGLALTVAAVLRTYDAGPERRAAVRATCCAFLAIPALVYVASYAQFFVQHPLDVVGFLRLQWYMFATNRRDHYFISATSPAWSWPLLLHPIRYFAASGATGLEPARGTILALGNPALFWGFLLLLPQALHRAVRRHDRSLRVVLAFYGVMLVPWLLLSRSEYFYYVLPCVPFMALAVVGALRALPPRTARAGAAGIAIAAVGLTMLFAPVWLGLPTTTARLSFLRWLPRWH